MVFTNVSKIINILKRLHSIATFCFECIQDSANLGSVPIDLALFGQPIPVGAPNRFNLLSKHNDFLD